MFKSFEGYFMIFKDVLRKLSRCLKKFHVSWHSSQLPEQKEGLFFYGFPKSDMEAGMLPQNCFENDALLRKIQTCKVLKRAHFGNIFSVSKTCVK